MTYGKRPMKIAVYTGTFNPLHIGHLAIMEYLTCRQDFDMVYLIVSPQSPFKGYMKAETGEERFRNAVAALARHPGLKVMADDIELHLPAPQYTIRTLDALKAREPGNSFSLVVGADNLANLHNWKDYRRILSEYGVVVFPRKGFDAEAIKGNLEKEFSEAHLPCTVRIAGAPLVDISSTEIREGMAAGRDMSGYLM